MRLEPHQRRRRSEARRWFLAVVVLALAILRFLLFGRQH
jgi:hypothetical protein